LQNGFDGLRLNGNTFWLEKNDWDDFKGYEETVNDVIDKHRMIAICSYSLEKCNASEIIDVVSNHQFAIIRRENKWNIIESSELKKTKEAEERYTNLIELAPDSIVTMDLKGYITSCNSAATRILGYSKDDLVGKHFSKIGILHVKDIPKYLKVFVSILRGKGTDVYELTVNDKDGASRIVETHIGLIKENNKISVILAITRDITERKKIEKEIIESEEKLKQILDSSPDAITVTDLNGNVIECNQTASKMYGSPKAELIYKNALEFVSPKDRKKAKDNLMKTLKAGSIKNEEYTLLTKDGREYPVELSASLIRDTSGNPQAFVAIVRDITERKKVENSLQQSEEKYHTIADFTYDFETWLGADGKYLYASPSCKRITGYYPEDFISNPLLLEQITHPDDRKKVKNHVHEEIKENDKKPTHIDFRIITNTGEERWINHYCHPVHNEEGVFLGTRASNRDITERKKAEDALKENEEKYRILFNDVPVGISITDKSGHIMDCNQYMAEIFRYTLEELKAINIKSLYMNLKDRERLLNLLNKEGRVVDWECSFKRKDGAVFFAILNVNIIDREGQKLNLTSLRDITERKVAEEKIKKQNVQLKKLDRVKTDFLNSTSHELRTPVASIKGYIQMLLKQTLGNITEEQKKALEVLLRNTNRLDHLIQDILDISRLESGTMKFITEKTDVTKMVNEIAETMQASADLKRIKINIDIQKEIPDLMIDQERIKQVLMNLVDNAIKFSPDSSTINIKARKEKENVLFEVQDFGRGIPKNKQKKIFERFYQVDSGIDRKFGGIGLGLTISKKIIDTYDGQIWVDSTLGKGSSFKFSLPLQSTKNIEGNLQEIMEWS
jgi:PAS domain S-box-containing protein